MTKVPNCRALPATVAQMVCGDSIRVSPSAILVGVRGTAYISGLARAEPCGEVVVWKLGDGYHADARAVDTSHRWERGVHVSLQPFRLRSLAGVDCN